MQFHCIYANSFERELAKKGTKFTRLLFEPFCGQFLFTGCTLFYTMDNKDKFIASRRRFIKESAAIGVGATALAGVSAEAQVRWDRTADVVVIGAGASGLPAAIMARDGGASVILIDANHDIGGHAMLSGGRVPLGGGTSLQKKYGIADSAAQVYLDHTNHTNKEFRHCDRDLVRIWANEK